MSSMKDDNADLLRQIRELIHTARQTVARSVDTIQVFTYFEIGRRIIEHEQHGKKRADYGKTILKELSVTLTKEFGRGFSEDNLSNMRKFFLTYGNQKNISETLSRKLPVEEKSQQAVGLIRQQPVAQKTKQVCRERKVCVPYF